MSTSTATQPLAQADVGYGDENTSMAVPLAPEQNGQQYEQDRPHNQPLNLLDLPVDILRLIVKEV